MWCAPDAFSESPAGHELLRLLDLAESRGELFIMGIIIIGPHSQIYIPTLNNTSIDVQTKENKPIRSSINFLNCWGFSFNDIV